jgi:hypothetical protein
MKRLLQLFALLALLALGWWAWTFFFPNPQKVILRRLDKIARLASFTSDESNLTRVVNIQKLGNYFADDVYVSVKIPEMESFVFNTRGELMSAAMGVRSSGRTVEARFYSIMVAIAPDGLSAEAALTAFAKIGGEKEPFAQRLKFTFKKINGAWLITRVEALPNPDQ